MSSALERIRNSIEEAEPEFELTYPESLDPRYFDLLASITAVRVEKLLAKPKHLEKYTGYLTKDELRPIYRLPGLQNLNRTTKRWIKYNTEITEDLLFLVGRIHFPREILSVPNVFYIREY